MILLPMVSGPEKPAFGARCNGCGYCCASEVCKLGEMVFETSVAPCPGLTWKDGRAWCGPMLASAVIGGEMHERLLLAMGAGLGCDSDDLSAEATRHE